MGYFKTALMYRKALSDKDTNYWFPDYQGKFTNLASKIRQQPIPPPYNKDAKFVPQKYLSDKQKEGLVWLDFGNYSYHKNINNLGYP